VLIKSFHEDEWFKQATVHSEGSLPLVTLLDADIVKTPLDIQFVKYFALQSFAINSEMSGSRYLFFTVMAFSAW